MLLTIITTIILSLFGKKIGFKIWNVSKIEIDEISREEAAMLLIEKKVNFVWRPQLVEEQVYGENIVPITSNKNKKKIHSRK